MTHQYEKRIICDFDETLAFVTGHDFQNAKVSICLINKLNEYVDAGWYVDIYTARGHLSCSSREEADKKYRAPIEELLTRYGLKYRILSFDKPFGAMYIDDKAIRPDEFVHLPNLTQ